MLYSRKYHLQFKPNTAKFSSYSHTESIPLSLSVSLSHAADSSRQMVRVQIAYRKALRMGRG